MSDIADIRARMEVRDERHHRFLDTDCAEAEADLETALAGWEAAEKRADALGFLTDEAQKELRIHQEMTKDDLACASDLEAKLASCQEVNRNLLVRTGLLSGSALENTEKP